MHTIKILTLALTLLFHTPTTHQQVTPINADSPDTTLSCAITHKGMQGHALCKATATQAIYEYEFKPGQDPTNWKLVSTISKVSNLCIADIDEFSNIAHWKLVDYPDDTVSNRNGYYNPTGHHVYGFLPENLTAAINQDHNAHQFGPHLKFAYSCI